MKVIAIFNPEINNGISVESSLHKKLEIQILKLI